MPDKSVWRVERPEGGPLGERSESSRKTNKLDPGYRIKSGTGPAGVTTYFAGVATYIAGVTVYSGVPCGLRSDCPSSRRFHTR